MGPINWNDFDVDKDERYKRRLKRKRFDVRSSEIRTCSHSLPRVFKDGQMGDEMIDDDYRRYLSCLGESSESRHSLREEVNDDCNDEDDMDPQYKMFLENLKEDGKSYILEVAKKDGSSMFIKYEAQGWSDDECSPQPRRELSNVTKRQRIETKNDLGNLQSLEKVGKHEILGNVLGKEKRNPVGEKHLRPEPVNPDSHGTKGRSSQKVSPEDNHISEPQFKCNSGKRVSEDECDPHTHRKLRSATKREQIEAKNDLVNAQNIDKVGKPKNSENVLGKERRNPVAERHLRSEPGNPVSHVTKEGFSQKHSPDDYFPSEPQCKRVAKNSTTDGSYQSFLNCIETEGDCLVFVTNSGRRVKYEEDDAESSDNTEILVMDNAPNCSEGKYTPFVTSRKFDASVNGDDRKFPGRPSKNDHSQFREEVMKLLERPYDHREYEVLFQDINARKPLERHRDTRGVTRSVATDTCSKSYLEQYRDLKKKIDAFKSERPKVLNILRGFFFWLQHLPHEGVFKPWLDTACLSVMPKSR